MYDYNKPNLVEIQTYITYYTTYCIKPCNTESMNRQSALSYYVLFSFTQPSTKKSQMSWQAIVTVTLLNAALQVLYKIWDIEKIFCFDPREDKTPTTTWWSRNIKWSSVIVNTTMPPVSALSLSVQYLRSTYYVRPNRKEDIATDSKIL